MIVSRDVTFDGGDCRLAGTLWLPAGVGPHPGVVMVGGSGPSNRDNDPLFPPIRAHLIDAGRGAPFAEVSRLLASAPEYQVLLGYGVSLDGLEWEFTRRKQDHDPVADVLRLHCPHLAVFGGADWLVPVPESAAIFAAAACAPDRAAGYGLTVRVFPGADHRVRLDSGEFAPGYLTALTGWIGAALAGRSGATGS